MELLDQGTHSREEPTDHGVTDDDEPKAVIRFQKGVDFETFDDFRKLYLSILRSAKLEEGERRIEELYESDMPSRVDSLPTFGGLIVSFPDSVLDFEKMRARIERVCREAGYEPPTICTPNELMEPDHADDTA